MSHLHFLEFWQRNCVCNRKIKRRNHSSQQCSKRAKGFLCRCPYLIQPCKHPSCYLAAPSQGSASVSLAGRMRRKHQEEHPRRKGREKSRMRRVRKQSKGRRVIREKTGLGRAQQRKEILLWSLLWREKLGFRSNVDKTKPNKKLSKKIKIRKVGGEFRLAWRGENT